MRLLDGGHMQILEYIVTINFCSFYLKAEQNCIISIVITPILHDKFSDYYSWSSCNA